MNVLRWTVSLALLGFCAGPAMAQETIQAAFNYDLVSNEEPACDAEEPDCCATDECCDACEDGCCEECGDECCDACGDGCCEECGDECCNACGDGCCEECGDGCCDSCGCDSGCGLFGCGCCLGEPYAVKDCLVDECCWLNVGGWTQVGYSSDYVGLSRVLGPLFDFNDVPDQINLHQQWAYFEKVAEADACSADWGFRFDVVYGTDAQKTQAFGNDGGTWDVTFDNGIYGWALPQAYAELAYGDWSWKIGHFFTPLGYEVIPAPSNFFFSHALTMFNSEPFTHTGALGTYSGFENHTIYAGWTLGWDTGYDQWGGGSNFLGGFSSTIQEDITFTYLCTAGNFGFRSADQSAYSHSIVAIADLTDKTQYVIQSDLVTSDGAFGDPDLENNDVGVNQYLFYTINDCWKAGGRLEWWKSDQVTGEDTSFYEVTGGVNYKPHANVVIRPEVRYDWTPSEDAVDDATGSFYNGTSFNVDVIVTY